MYLFPQGHISSNLYFLFKVQVRNSAEFCTLNFFNVFKVHQVSGRKELMIENNIGMRYVPAGCTLELQLALKIC